MCRLRSGGKSAKPDTFYLFTYIKILLIMYSKAIQNSKILLLLFLMCVLCQVSKSFANVPFSLHL